ncbi:uncharacterized protein LOC129597266 [Paramacrobiotus metropolitanus]|uniref:uncharacterized protein LOC129597266 n=1 Tax=Paramacrobiotus metropolitanus TaxID=2943436 RepID=UPI0024465C50|nr:uncharacterized protein LOC129597266 [Paramacrobiotus metropolitanus]
MWAMQGCIILLSIIVEFSYSASHLQLPNGMYNFWPINPSATTTTNNGDTAYRISRVRIGYVRDSIYPLAEYSTLTNAMDRIKTATKGCIEFAPYDQLLSSVPQSKLHIRNQPETGTINACRTHPGYVIDSQGAGQVIFLFGSLSKGNSTAEHGCLDDERETTRYLLNLLGIVNEFQRPDRASVGVSFPRGYNNRTKSYLRNEYLFFPKQDAVGVERDLDVDSVTMITPEQYAASPDEPLFVLGTGVSVSPSISGRLSQKDCELLNLIYDCGITCGSALPEIVLNPPTRVANFHCWNPNEAGQPFSALEERGETGRIGSLELNLPAPSTSTDVLQYSFGSSDPKLKIRTQTFNNADKSVAIGLPEKISRGFRTSATVGARAGGRVVARGDIEVWVNCWPHFRVNNGIMVPCGFGDNPEENPVLGLRDVPFCSYEHGPPLTTTSACEEDGSLRPGQVVFSIRATDPDGSATQSELIAVTTKKPDPDSGVPVEEDETSNWIYSTETGAMITLARISNINEAPLMAFRVLFHDTTYSSIVNPEGSVLLELTVNLKCPEN